MSKIFFYEAAEEKKRHNDEEGLLQPITKKKNACEMFLEGNVSLIWEHSL